MQENTPSPKGNYIGIYNFLSIFTVVFLFLGLGFALEINAITPQNTIYFYERTPDPSEALSLNQSIPLAPMQNYGWGIQIGTPPPYEPENTGTFNHRPSRLITQTYQTDPLCEYWGSLTITCEANGQVMVLFNETIGIPYFVGTYPPCTSSSGTYDTVAFETGIGNETLLIQFTGVGCPISIHIYRSNMENIILYVILVIFFASVGMVVCKAIERRTFSDPASSKKNSFGYGYTTKLH
ncbi:MAG: hypothetical protein RBG13Loki_1974 [Promethearchaeota archaeon CR_4]|nr:MAG: hypothetical protein RBG13Loki_1974 [Candidatus Lokiarchaeota archaeon CR_4]